MRTYYVTKSDGSQIGPLAVESVAKLRLHGKIDNHSLIWTEGMDEWQPINTVFPSELIPTEPWNIVNAFTHSFKTFGNISGRASRAEYWLFQLDIALFWILILVMSILARDSEEGRMICLILAIFGMLATCIPALCLTIRRLHDIGMSGWCLLINLIPACGIIFFIFTILPSQGANRYGLGPTQPLKH